MKGHPALSSPDHPQFDPPPAQPGSELPAVSVEPLLFANEALAANAPSVTPTAPPPVEDPAWSGWDVLALTGLAFLAIIVLQFAVAAVAHALWYPHDSLGDIVQKTPLLLLSQILFYIPVAAFMVLLVKSKDGGPFGPAIRWNWPRSKWTMLALGASMFFALTLLQAFLPMPKDTPFEHLFDNPLDAYLLSLLAVTIGPLMEELFFRGFLYPVLARRTGVVLGIVLSALPFGLLHLQQYGWAWAAGLIIFLVGVVCGAVRAATKSVGASFLVHAGYNGTQMLIALITTQGFRHMERAVIVQFNLR